MYMRRLRVTSWMVGMHLRHCLVLGNAVMRQMCIFKIYKY